MKIIYKMALTLIILLSMSIHIYSWEIYDRVIATVNEVPIIESDLMNRYNSNMNKKTSSKKRLHEISRLLDRLIEEAIVYETAEREYIIISEEKIDNHLQMLMKRMNIKSLKDFKKIIESKENMSFDQYRKQVRTSLVTEQVMSIAIGISPPSSKEARDYYNKNKKEMGFEINIQHILIRLKNETFDENKRVNKIVKDLYKRITKGERFEAIAAQYSEESVSKNSNGHLGWKAMSTLAKEDMLFANNLYKEFIIDQSSAGAMKILKSGKGYHIVKLIGKRRASFESVEADILNVLYQQKMAKQFKKWVNKKRLEADIKIYMGRYIKD